MDVAQRSSPILIAILSNKKFGENPQAALHGLLNKVRDLGIPMISVNRAVPGQGDTAQPTAPDVNVIKFMKLIEVYQKGRQNQRSKSYGGSIRGEGCIR